MSIIYSLIARLQEDKTPVILTSYDSASGNYPHIVMGLLNDLPLSDLAKTFSYNAEYNFHVLKESSLVMVAMTEVGFNQKFAFLFLEDLKKKLLSKFNLQQIKMAVAYAVSAEFQPIYKNLVTYYNTHQEGDSKAELTQRLGELRGVLSDNIEKLLERHDKLTILVNKTRHLDDLTVKVKGNATRMKNEAFWRNNKCKIFMGGAALVALGAIVIIL